MSRFCSTHASRTSVTDRLAGAIGRLITAAGSRWCPRRSCGSGSKIPAHRVGPRHVPLPICVARVGERQQPVGSSLSANARDRECSPARAEGALPIATTRSCGVIAACHGSRHPAYSAGSRAVRLPARPAIVVRVSNRHRAWRSAVAVRPGQSRARCRLSWPVRRGVRASGLGAQEGGVIEQPRLGRGPAGARAVVGGATSRSRRGGGDVDAGRLGGALRRHALSPAAYACDSSRSGGCRR